MNRRQFLKAGALTLFMGLGDPLLMASNRRGLPGFLPRMAEAATPGRTLVALFLDGGVDSLNFLVPHGERRYYECRRKLALPPPGKPGGALPLEPGLGLHPSLAPLAALYREGVLAFLQAIGTDDRSRSHFEARDHLELSGGPVQRREGWLNRLLQKKPPRDPAAPMRAVSTSQALRLAMMGPLPIMTLRSLESLQGFSPSDPVAGSLFSLYGRQESPRLRRNAEYVREVLDRLVRLKPERYRPAPGVVYPQTELGDSLRLVAFLIKAGVPLELAFAELGGWDTHANQGTLEGDMAGLQRDLAGSLLAFWRDLGPYRDRVAVITMTEFGRRVAANGSGGTDHGHGSVALALGGSVRGGRLVGRWPGLDEDRLFEGQDLAVTLDYRDFFVEASRWLGCPDPLAVFPGFRSAQRLGVFS